jgi:outer membrane lipoprotein SlyB
MNCNHAIAAFAIAGIVATSGCASMTPQEKHLAGQIAGGATGAALGSLIGGGTGRLVAIGAGAVLGTIAGGKIADKQ